MWTTHYFMLININWTLLHAPKYFLFQFGNLFLTLKVHINGMGWGGVGHEGVGWGGSLRGEVGHIGVGWGVIKGYVMQGWGGSCRCGVGYVIQGWVGHLGVGWVMQG